MRKLKDMMLISAGVAFLILSLLPCLIMALIDIVRSVEDEPMPEPLQIVV